MYKPKFFVIQEFVSPTVYKMYGEKAWQFLDSRLLITADQLREQFGPMVINTWHSDKLIAAYGKRTESGLRDPHTATGAKYSQHKFGRAADAIFSRVSAAEVRKYVLENKSQFPYLTSLETDVSWFHFDVRNVEPIAVFKP